MSSHPRPAQTQRCKNESGDTSVGPRGSDDGSSLGPNAAEVINLFAMAIRLRIPADDLKQVLFAYPTDGSDIRFML